MSSLPVTIYQYAGSAFEDWVQLAWVGALLITAGVLALNILARLAAAPPPMRRNRPMSSTTIAAQHAAGDRDRRRASRPPTLNAPAHLGAQPRFPLRQQPCAEGDQPRSAGQAGDGHDRPVGLRQVHAAARAEPDVRSLSRPARDRRGADGRAEHTRRPISTSTRLRSRIGMVFQKPTPFPMSIYDNIAFGVRLHEKLSRSQMDERVEWSLTARRAVDRGEGPALRRRPPGSPAASSSASASRAPSRCGPR